MFKMKISGNSEIVNRIKTRFNNQSFFYRAKIHLKVWWGFKKSDIIWYLSGCNLKRYHKIVDKITKD